jgi:hypothetical protein
MSLLQKDETLIASTEVRASADQAYAVISDVTRILSGVQRHGARSG